MRPQTIRADRPLPPIGGEGTGPQGLPPPSRPSPSMRRTDWLCVIVLTAYVAFAGTLLWTGFGRQRAACVTIGHVIELGCREER